MECKSMKVMSNTKMHISQSAKAESPIRMSHWKAPYSHGNSSRKELQPTMESKSMKVMSNTQNQIFQCAKVSNLMRISNAKAPYIQKKQSSKRTSTDNGMQIDESDEQDAKENLSRRETVESDSNVTIETNGFP
jgi:hypothetical protein